MNDYQKAIKRGIETGLDNHFSKNEPKVCLTVEEAKAVQAIMEEVFFKNEVLTKRGMEDWKLFCDKIEQAEIFQIGEDYNKALNKALAEFQEQTEK